jgi:ABC-type transport system substrate-binding protein
MARTSALSRLAAGVPTLILILSAVLAPSAVSAHRLAAPAGTLTAAFDADFTSLDPAIGYDPFSWTGEHSIFNALLDYASAGGRAGTRLVPSLATTLPVVTNGGRIYTFHLRPGVRFAPPVRREVTAADVKYSIERALAKSTAGPMYQSPFFSPLSGTKAFWNGKAAHIRGIHVLGRYTIQFRLDSPDLAFENILALPFADVVPHEIVARYGSKHFSDHVVGTGPYMLQSWQHGRQMVLVKNPLYFVRGLPHVPRVVIQFNVDDHLQVLRAERNQLDLPGNIVTSADYLALRTSPYRGQMVPLRDIGVEYLAMNTQMAPFKSNLTLRRAFNMAIDRTRIIRLLNGRAVPMYGILPPTMPGANPTFRYYSYNPGQAKRMIQQAGYKPGRLSLTLLYISGPDLDRVADSIRSDLAAVGVNVTLKGVSSDTAYNTVYTPGKTAFTLFHWGQDYPDPSDFFDPILSCAASSNAAQFCDPAVDRLGNAARADTNGAHRYATYRKMESMVMAQAPWVPLYTDILYEFHSARVKGFYYHPVWPFRYDEYRL